MTYLYTSNHALTLPACLTMGGRGVDPGIRFQWAGRNKIRVSRREETFVLDLRPASEADRAGAINRDGWAYVAPSK